MTEQIHIPVAVVLGELVAAGLGQVDAVTIAGVVSDHILSDDAATRESRTEIGHTPQAGTAGRHEQHDGQRDARQQHAGRR